MKASSKRRLIQYLEASGFCLRKDLAGNIRFTHNILTFKLAWKGQSADKKDHAIIYRLVKAITAVTSVATGHQNRLRTPHLEHHQLPDFSYKRNPQLICAPWVHQLYLIQHSCNPIKPKPSCNPPSSKIVSRTGPENLWRL